MNIKKAVEKRREHDDADVDLTAVMNIFLILIPFLLLTAVFVKIAVLELSLPNLNQAGKSVQQDKPNKSIVLNFLFIKENGFEFKSPDLNFPPLPRKTQGEFDWQGLTEQLSKAKTRYPESEDIFIAPGDMIKYETIITVMDYCREAGFPNVSISG